PWDTERADRVPDSDKLDFRLVRMLRPETDGRFAIRGCFGCVISIQRYCFVLTRFMTALENARIPYQPGQTSHRIRAAAETEKVYLVAGFVVQTQKPVTIDYVLEDTTAKASSPEPL